MILDRPLFRQAGGPIMPPEAAMAPGPPPVAPPPVPSGPPPMPPGPPPGAGPEVAVAAAEEEAALAGEELGLGYLQSVTSALDGAEDYEQVINAIRGNDAPIEERYEELAVMVGEEDARNTPESVLTLVQPTILLTEEGSIDSGVGQLMEQMIGEISEPAPPEMTQGIGELMVEGQAAPPAPVQNFAQGGIVQHFQNGGSPWMGDPLREHITGYTPKPARPFEEVYEERSPYYQAILGSPEERKERTRREMMLDIAQAGFNLAAGTNPRTGESIAGQPFLSQVGTVMEGMPKRVSERLAEQRKADQAAKLATLQSAERTQSAEAAREAATAQGVLGAAISGALQSERLGESGRQFDLTTAQQYKIFKEGNQFARTEREGRQEFQERIAVKAQEYTRNNLRLTEEINEAYAQNRQVEALELVGERHKNTVGLQELAHAQTLERMEEQFEDAKDLTTLEARFRRVHQDDAQAYDKDRLATVQLFNKGENEKDRAIRQRLMLLEEEKFELQQGLAPSTTRPFWGMGQSQADRLNELNLEARELQNKALEQGIPQSALDSDVRNYIGLRSLALQEKTQHDRSMFQLFGLIAEDKAQKGFDKPIDMQNYLADPLNLQAYASGAPMPYFEQAITQVFKPEYDRETSTMLPASLPSGLESALRIRQGLGITIPDRIIPRSYKEGGEVDNLYLEPITGGYLERPSLDKPDPYPTEPLITALPGGMDITKGTGSFTTPALEHIIEPFVGVLGDIAGGQDWKISEETSEAVRAVNALNRIATMRIMESLAGRESNQLRELIASMQVPAGEFFYDDTKALGQFKTASRVTDFAIREQERLMSLGELPRKERIQAEQELTTLTALNAEYENVITMYERKLGRTEKDWESALDQFFIR